MIRHIYVAKLKPGTPDAKIAAWGQAIRGLSGRGMLALDFGADLGLRDGNQDVAITADFVDVDAWRRYDQDERHNQIRNEHAKPIVESQQRVQFQSRRHREQLGDIRNVTLITLKEGTPAMVAAHASERLLTLRCKGMHHLDCGPDLGLQPGNASVGVICDFDSPEAYGVYDRDDLHNEIRRVDVLPHMEGARRVQFELDAAPVGA